MTVEKDELERRIAELRVREARALAEANACAGAIQVLSELLTKHQADESKPPDGS
jgi:hypothetical protein